MNLNLNGIIQTITTLLLIVTILLTYRQLRETAKQTKKIEATLQSSAYQQMIQDQTNSRVSFFLQYPDLLKWHLETRGHTPAGETADRIRLYIMVKLDFHENMYLRHRDGSLTEEPWAAWHRVMQVDFTIDLFQEVWEKEKQFYAPAFRGFVDRELLSQKSLVSSRSPIENQKVSVL